MLEQICLSKQNMNVLSLCDGMSCGQIALEQVGIKVDKYFASEIKPIAIKVTKYNYPNTIHIGDVNKISYNNGVLYTENGNYETSIDMVIFGSPCQSFSIAMKKENRIGLEDKKKSGLFLDCYRILKEINPKYYLMENVSSMKDSDRDYISNLLGVSPFKIDSSIVSPCYRKRYYWTNIPNITPLTPNKILFKDVLDNGWYTDREIGRCLMVSDSRPLTNPVKMFHRYYKTGFTNLIFKSKEHYDQCVYIYNKYIKDENKDNISPDILKVFNGVRYLNQNELERCQGVPKGYTKCLTRNEAANVLGDGWTIGVITYFFQFIDRQ